MRYSFDSQIRYSETDEQGRLSLGSLVDYFQDCSVFQSAAVGLPISYLREEGRAWILSSWQIVLERLPRLGEAVKAWTWAYDFKSFYGLRNFMLTDREGRPAAWANSVWVMMDLNRMRPTPVTEEEIRLYAPEARLEMEYASRKIALPSSENCENQTEEPFHVARHHLDTNHHVNNRQYISMAQEYLPEGFEIGQVRVEYRRQALLGDMIVPQIFRKEGSIMVLLNHADGKPYAVVEFIKRPSQNGEQYAEIR